MFSPYFLFSKTYNGTTIKLLLEFPKKVGGDFSAQMSKKGGPVKQDHSKFLRLLSKVGLRGVVGGVKVQKVDAEEAIRPHPGFGNLGTRIKALTDAALTDLPHYDSQSKEVSALQCCTYYYFPLYSALFETII